MATVHQVDPESFIDVDAGKPAQGRGAWTRVGIGFDYRYAVSEDPAQRIGTLAQKSLDHWAVAAGAYAIQLRLIALGHMAPLGASERGIFGPRTRDAVQTFQRRNGDPDGGAQLDDDGTVGRSDARALFTPLVLGFEQKHRIPGRLLLGETYHESALDPGAVGYQIFYPGFRGVDRGQSQINSRSNPQVTWLQAYDPLFALDWSGARLRSYHDLYADDYPTQTDRVLWDAAVCAHNNPSAARTWARTGAAPSGPAATYVNAVKAAIYQ